jgi:hypothetical protein
VLTCLFIRSPLAVNMLLLIVVTVRERRPLMYLKRTSYHPLIAMVHRAAVMRQLCRPQSVSGASAAGGEEVGLSAPQHLATPLWLAHWHARSSPPCQRGVDPSGASTLCQHGVVFIWTNRHRIVLHNRLLHSRHQVARRNGFTITYVWQLADEATQMLWRAVYNALR